jgi:hypothetical protein
MDVLVATKAKTTHQKEGGSAREQRRSRAHDKLGCDSTSESNDRLRTGMIQKEVKSISVEK